MVFVDFGNPWLRTYIEGFPAAHKERLDEARSRIAGWCGESRAKELEAGGSRPLAAVFDIDEIILANIHMNSFEAPAGEQGVDPIDFHAADVFGWPRDHELNPLLPGGRAILEEAVRLGMAVFFVSGRHTSFRAETVENFVAVGLVGDGPGHLFRRAEFDSRLLLCPDVLDPGESIRPFKERCRAEISATYRIALNIGDQVSDLGLYGDVHYLVPHPFYFTL